MSIFSRGSGARQGVDHSDGRLQGYLNDRVKAAVVVVVVVDLPLHPRLHPHVVKTVLAQE